MTPTLERIRQIVEEARERAPDTGATLPKHWQETAEERDEVEFGEELGPDKVSLPSFRSTPAVSLSPVSLEMGEVVARAAASFRLRKLLADGAWHSALELAEVGGLRFGGRLFDPARARRGAAARRRGRGAPARRAPRVVLPRRAGRAGRRRENGDDCGRRGRGYLFERKKNFAQKPHGGRNLYGYQRRNRAESPTHTLSGFAIRPPLRRNLTRGPARRRRVYGSS